MLLPGGESIDDHRDCLRRRGKGCVYAKRSFIPWLIFMIHYRLPGGWRQPGNIDRSCFDPASMFVFIGANHMDVRQSATSLQGDFAPRDSAFKDGIDAINNDGTAQTKIIQSKLIGNHVTTASHVLRKSARVSNCLLNRIDAQVHGARLNGEIIGDSRFSGTGKAAEDDEHSISF